MAAYSLRRFILVLGAGTPATLLMLSLVAMLSAVAAAFEPPSAADGAVNSADSPTYTYCASPTTPIPDGDGTRLQSTLLLTDALQISNMSVVLSVSHSWPGDLSFTLSHVDSGLAITLIDRPGVPDSSTYGCSVDDIDAFLDDAAVEAAEDACALTPPGIGGHLRPEQPLGTFAEVLLAGTWILSAQDHAAGQVGVLEEWCLVASGSVPPVASLIPDRVTTVQGPDQTLSRTVLVGNAGGEPLTWQLGASSSAPAGPVVTSTFVLSEGFESDVFPPTGWTISNTTVTPTWALTDHLRGRVVYAGQPDTAWQLEAWLLTPPLDLSTATLTFWSVGSVYLCRDSYNRCDLNIWLVTEDDAALFVQHVDDDWSGESEWVRSEILLDPLLTAGPVRIAFHYRGQGVSVLLDDVRIAVPAPTYLPLCECGGEIPWLTGFPLSGELAPGANSAISLTFNAAGLNEGVYSGTLCLESNDPATPGLPLPVTMTVDACGLQPAVAVPLAAARAGADLLLQWESTTANRSYEIHTSLDPFFQPEGASRIAVLPGTDTAYVDEQALAETPAAFYRVRALNCDGVLPADSATAGFFSYSLR